MDFGNWAVTEDSIEWKGEGLNRFVIPANELTQTTEEKSDEIIVYEWLLLATQEAWLTQNDLYDLNYAFVYAMAKFNLDFDYAIFEDTLDEQFEQFDAEDREDFEL